MSVRLIMGVWFKAQKPGNVAIFIFIISWRNWTRCTSALWNVVRWTSDSGHHSTCRPPTWLPTWLTPPCWPWPHPKGMTFMASRTLMCEDLVRAGFLSVNLCVVGWWFEITSGFAGLVGLPLGVLWHVMKSESALRSRWEKQLLTLFSCGKTLVYDICDRQLQLRLYLMFGL